MEDADAAAHKFTALIDAKMDEFFPWKKYKSKTTDDPWITPLIKRRIKTRKKTYKQEERSIKWRDQKKETVKLIRESKRSYYNEFFEKSKTCNKPSLYYNMVNRLKESTSRKPFSVSDLFPDLAADVVAEKVADFFTNIAKDFVPLTDRDVPVTERKDDSIQLEEAEVLDRVKSCKKPKGLLSGDVFPSLLTSYAQFFAPPLTKVINKAFKQEIWPEVWKLETVTIIPKTQNPSQLGETRNISCTPVFAKTLEFFLLRRLKKKRLLNITNSAVRQDLELHTTLPRQ